MIVNSRQLDRAAGILRERGEPLRQLRDGTATVSAAQLDAAATLLRAAGPCVCNGLATERPGFIEPEGQSETLTFHVGTLPATTYRIARDGSYEVVP